MNTSSTDLASSPFFTCFFVTISFNDNSRFCFPRSAFVKYFQLIWTYDLRLFRIWKKMYSKNDEKESLKMICGSVVKTFKGFELRIKKSWAPSPVVKWILLIQQRLLCPFFERKYIYLQLSFWVSFIRTFYTINWLKLVLA